MDILHRMHFYTLLFLMRESTREFTQWASALNSSDSSEHLWLVIAFISPTESPLIGYIMSRAWKIQRHFIKYNKYYSDIFCLLEAAFKFHLALKFEVTLWMGMTPLTGITHGQSLHVVCETLARLHGYCISFRCHLAFQLVFPAYQIIQPYQNKKETKTFK